MNKEVHQYLTVPENLEAAVQIASVLPEVTLRVYEDFWGGVRDRLAWSLQQEDLAGLWCPDLNEVDAGCDSWAGIIFRERGEVFCVGAANLTGGPAGCGFGVNRGRAVPRDKWVPRDQELAGALAREDYKSEPWWAGWKRFSHAGVVSLDLLSINQDNREGGRVAKQVADLLWDLFNRHRAVLEDLNQGYPYL